MNTTYDLIELIGKYVKVKEEITRALSLVGIKPGLHIEAIVTTKDYNGGYRSRPFGIRFKNYNTLELKVYKPSRTLDNIIKYPFLSINLTDDVEVFYKALFNELKREDYDFTCYAIGIPSLRDIDAFIEAKVLNYIDYDEYVLFILDVIGLLIRNVRVGFYTRCKHAVLESLIHLTRMPIYADDPTKLNKLLDLIKHYSDIVNRICPNEPYKRIMNNILSKAGLLGR